MSKPKTVATINDIARMAGVSKRTVSRVLNNSPKVNQETREKIQKLMEEYKYSPSKQARGLASSRSYLLGLLYDDFNAVLIQQVQRGILATCSKYGYEMIVHPVDYRSPTLVEEVLHLVERSKVDGLVVLPPISANEEVIAALKERGIHYVRIASKQVDEPEKMVVSEDRIAMKQAAAKLHELDRKEIGVILGPSHRLASSERFEGLQDALKTYGIKLKKSLQAVGDNSYESGLICAKKLLSLKTPPDAIVAGNDQMAIATIHMAEDMGFKVPADVMVVGYDNDPMSARLRPSLSTFERPNTEMARVAALKLISGITKNNQLLQDLPTTFIPQLICRKSTGCDPA